jgi:hypothetical protein
VIKEAAGGLTMGQIIGIELATRGGHRELLPPREISRVLADVLMSGLRTHNRPAQSPRKDEEKQAVRHRKGEQPHDPPT